MYLAANLKYLRKKSGKTQDALSFDVKIGRKRTESGNVTHIFQLFWNFIGRSVVKKHGRSAEIQGKGYPVKGGVP